jgi:hypothetical protein
MKKILLSIPALMMYAAATFAQNSFTQANNNTGFTYDCDLGIAQSAFSWGVWGPACAGADNGGGGIDEAPVNELGVQWGQSGKGQAWIILTLTTPLDLSATANQKIKVSLRNIDPNTKLGVPIKYNVRLEDASNAQLTSHIPINVTGTTEAFTIDLSNNIMSGKSLAAVKKIIFLYDGCAEGTVYDPTKLFFSDFKVGSYLVDGIEDELASRINSTTVYPNPATTGVNLSVDLKQISAVKVVLNNAIGAQVKVIADQTTTNLTQSFSVADLSAGVYFLSYHIDGVAVKTEKLIVE